MSMPLTNRVIYLSISAVLRAHMDIDSSIYYSYKHTIPHDTYIVASQAPNNGKVSTGQPNKSSLHTPRSDKISWNFFISIISQKNVVCNVKTIQIETVCVSICSMTSDLTSYKMYSMAVHFRFCPLGPSQSPYIFEIYSVNSIDQHVCCSHFSI